MNGGPGSTPRSCENEPEGSQIEHFPKNHSRPARPHISSSQRHREDVRQPISLFELGVLPEISPKTMLKTFPKTLCFLAPENLPENLPKTSRTTFPMAPKTSRKLFQWPRTPPEKLLSRPRKPPEKLFKTSDYLTSFLYCVFYEVIRARFRITGFEKLFGRFSEPR